MVAKKPKEPGVPEKAPPAAPDGPNSSTNSEAVEEPILRKYEFNQKLGKGAYGVVWKVTYKLTRQPCALKKVFHAWRTRRDAQSIYREVMYLEALKGHDNIVDMRRMFHSADDRDLYIEFEYCEADLYGVIRANILQESHKRYLTYQLLRGLKYLHSAGLVHRDVRPSNILVRPDCSLKIADLGNCRSVEPGEGILGGPPPDTLMTEYTSARWYRAPEVLLGSHDYGKAVDMWGAGCCLAEMIRLEPIFPGTSTLDQIKQILALTGRPSDEEIVQLRSPFAATILDDVHGYEPRALSEIFPTAHGEALDLLRLTLQFSPDRRPMIEEALRHPWVMDYANPEDEPTMAKPVKLYACDDILLGSPIEYRDLVYERIVAQNLAIEKAEALSTTGFLTA